MYKHRLSLGLRLVWEFVCVLVAGIWIGGLEPVEFLSNGRVLWEWEGVDLSRYDDYPEHNYDIQLEKMGVVAEGSPEF